MITGHDGLDEGPDGETVVRLHLCARAEISPGRLMAVLDQDQAPWLGEALGFENGLRDYACDFELRVRPESRALFRKAAIVSLGRPQYTDTGLTIACEWRAMGLAPLFPIFVGRLTITGPVVSLDGYYAPPLGLVGVAIDRALLGGAARTTARWFLNRVTVALTQAS